MEGIMGVVDNVLNKQPVEIEPALAKDLVAELESALMSGSIYRRDLVALYRFLKSDLEEMGGCDHSVGICSCSLADVLQSLARKLGYPTKEVLGCAVVDPLPTSDEVR